MAGTSARLSPTDCARRSRKASLKRASVNVVASTTTIQKAVPRRPIWLRESGERTDGVERLAQSEACAAQLGRRDIGDQGIARRAADALADAVDEARGE